jgi:diaminopimelate epimerase
VIAGSASGGDGALFISPLDKMDMQMRLFQPDANGAEMCDKGIRCLAKYACDNGYAKTKSFSVETLAGVLTIRSEYDSNGGFFAVIDMGVSVYDSTAIPAVEARDFVSEIEGMMVYAVNTGVPHAGVFVAEVESVDIDVTAPKIRHNGLFPKGTNVNFVQVTAPSTIMIQTFERSVESKTLSCGTGSKVSGDVIHVDTAGGPLDIEVGGRAMMTEAAEMVFVGKLPF